MGKGKKYGIGLDNDTPAPGQIFTMEGKNFRDVAPGSVGVQVAFGIGFHSPSLVQGFLGRFRDWLWFLLPDVACLIQVLLTQFCRFDGWINRKEIGIGRALAEISFIASKAAINLYIINQLERGVTIDAHRVRYVRSGRNPDLVSG